VAGRLRRLRWPRWHRTQAGHPVR